MKIREEIEDIFQQAKLQIGFRPPFCFGFFGTEQIWRFFVGMQRILLHTNETFC